LAEPGHVAGCPFCAIAQNQGANVRVVASTASWIAFFPPEPATAGHTLVIPRTHVANLWEADEATASAVVEGAIRVGRAIQSALMPEGMNLITSAGDAAEQTVFHLHLHVVPRWHQDEFGRIWPPKGRVSPATVDDAFERVSHAFTAGP
jgi:histidine triad (HIT) family protein